MIDPEVIAGAFGVGAALLAFWLVLRFPAAGPQRLRSACLGVGVSLLLANVVPPLAAVVERTGGRWGAPVALLVVALPGLTLTFWLAACLVRTCARGGVRTG